MRSSCRDHPAVGQTWEPGGRKPQISERYSAHAGRAAEPSPSPPCLGLTSSVLAALIPSCPGTQEEAEEREVGYM